jgi:hypothetical protein
MKRFWRLGSIGLAVAAMLIFASGCALFGGSADNTGKQVESPAGGSGIAGGGNSSDGGANGGAAGGAVKGDTPDTGTGSGSANGSGGGGTTNGGAANGGGKGGAANGESAGGANGGGTGGATNGNDGTNGGTGDATNGNGATNDSTGQEEQPKIVAENEAFRIYEPVPDGTVSGSFVVKGQARVFEAAFSYSFEDGHNVLAEGHVMADQGAPEWGNFEFTVKFDKPTGTTGVLTIYEASAKDGTPIHELHIPEKFDEKPISGK